MSAKQPDVPSDHVHDWQPPPPNAQGGYTCACGTTGWRCNNGPDRGKIVPHKQKKTYGPSQVMHVAGGGGAGHKRHGRRGPGGW